MPGKFRGQECSYDAALGTVSRTEQASEQLFKRVLYNWFNLDVKEGGTIQRQHLLSFSDDLDMLNNCCVQAYDSKLLSMNAERSAVRANVSISMHISSKEIRSIAILRTCNTRMWQFCRIAVLVL